MRYAGICLGQRDGRELLRHPDHARRQHERPSPPSSVVRTGPKLTVWIDTVAGDLGNNPAGVAAIVDETWGQIVGPKE